MILKKNHIIELDSVRAIAALSVMLLHFIPNINSSNILVLLIKRTHSIFQFGVPIFFVLSGFLITRILLKTKESSCFFLDFYIKRSLRIFPLYYFICLCVIFVFPILFENFSSTSLKSFYPNFFYLQNFFISFHIPYDGPNHFWSLAVEEHFYLIWPIVVYFLNIKRVKALILISLLFLPFLRILLIHFDVDIYYFTFTRLDEILFGALLAINEVEQRKISARKIIWALVLIIILFILFALFSGDGNIFIQGIKYSIFGFIFYCLVGYVSLNNITGLRYLRNKFLVFTGKISYGLYIYHPFVFSIMIYYFNEYSVFFFFLGSFGITYTISIISFYLFEKPILNLKRYFIVNS